MSPAPLLAWTEDEVLTGRIIFGTKTCAQCGEKLPANSDYFTVDRSRDDGLTGACRRCRAALGARYYAENGQHRREAQRRYARRKKASGDGGMMASESAPATVCAVRGHGQHLNGGEGA